MNNQVISETLQKIQLKASEYRGRIIDATIQVEGIIESTLAQYFCDDEKKINYFLSLFLGSTTNFIDKRNALKILLENEFIDFHKQHEGLLKEIEEIRILRNDLAHSKINTELEKVKTFDGKTIEFFCLKNGKEKRKTLDAKTMNEHIIKINRTLDTLLELNKIVANTN